MLSDLLKDIQEFNKDDNEVNLRLASLSEKCSKFITTLNDAKAREDKDQRGISLSLYLQAERIYPNSLRAKSGIERLADKILPENTPSAAPAAPDAVFAPADSTAPATAPALR